MRLLLPALVIAQTVAAQQGALQPAKLECDARSAPINVDSAAPRFSWQAVSGSRGASQSAFRILVATSEALLAEGRADLWDSGRVASTESSAAYGGKPLASNTAYYWRLRLWDNAGSPSAWSRPEPFSTALLTSGEWRAGWIAVPDARLTSGPMPLFRKELTLPEGIRRAVLHVAGLGFYELRLNGQRVGDREFAPGWTNYRASVLYDTYDVTALLRGGANAIGVMLGNGFFNVVGGRYAKYTGSFGRPKLRLQLHVALADGSTQVIGSDNSWKTAPGPITFSCVFGGEDYDARLEQRGWDSAGFDDSAWRRAAAADQHTGVMRAHTAPPIRVMERFQTVSVKEPKPGVRVYDLGQNMAGRPRLRVSGAAGTSVKLIPGELLDQDGTVTQRSSGGPMWYTYTLAGGGREEWAPRFTYYGFRYVQVETTAAVESVAGEFIHADAPRVGAFESSSELFNRIHKLVDMAVRSNLQSVLTDCPHREKLGWLEVAHLMGPSLMFNYDLRGFYTKIMHDMEESQTASGLVPDIAPEFVVFQGGFRDSPEWGSAAIQIPRLLDEWYGDSATRRRFWPLMTRYAEYLEAMTSDGVLSHGLGDWYDIGPGAPGASKLTPKGITATAFLYANLDALARAASGSGRPEEAGRWRERAAAARLAFNRAFFHAGEGTYGSGSQTAQAMPLVLGLVDPAARPKVLANLVADVEKRGWQQTAGDVGYRFMIRALTDGNRSDVLARINSRTEPPSYGAQLAAGATTLTEAWDANPRSSQNHCMLGHVEEWFYSGLGGIRVDSAAPGFRRFDLRPEPVGGLSWVKVSYDSVRGPIVSDWKIAAGRFAWNVRIPPGAEATLWLPASSRSDVLESDGLRFLRMEDGRAVFAAGSGEYRLAARAGAAAR